MGAIVDIQLKQLDKLLEDRKIVLELTPEAREWLAEKGYDPAYGARPLKRVIQKTRAGSAGRARFWPAKSTTASACGSAPMREALLIGEDAIRAAA